MPCQQLTPHTHALVMLLAGAWLMAPVPATAGEKMMPPVEQGKKLSVAFCQACHFFEGTEQAGTVGPPFVAMKQRFPDREKLRNIIFDPHFYIKPYSMMPPFGRNELLTKEQIDKVVEFLYTL